MAIWDLQYKNIQDGKWRFSRVKDGPILALFSDSKFACLWKGPESKFDENNSFMYMSLKLDNKQKYGFSRNFPK